VDLTMPAAAAARVKVPCFFNNAFASSAVI
jgi:hypothetical protein